MTLALLLIDMQDAFVKDIARDRKDSLIDSQLKIIDYFTDRNLPIVNVMFGNSPLVEKLSLKISSYPNASEIRKIDCSAFYDTNLHEKLSDKDVSDVLYSGVFAFGCITASMRDGSKFFNSYTADDLIANHDYYHASYPGISERKMYFKESDLGKYIYFDNQDKFRMYALKNNLI